MLVRARSEPLPAKAAVTFQRPAAATLRDAEYEQPAAVRLSAGRFDDGLRSHLRPDDDRPRTGGGVDREAGSLPFAVKRNGAPRSRFGVSVRPIAGLSFVVMSPPSSTGPTVAGVSLSPMSSVFP